jgi:hypothetical protein
MRLLVCFLLATLAPATAPAGARGPARTELVNAGSFHGDEITARSGQQWLGLFVTTAGSKLEPVMIRVSRVHDPIVDETERVKTGKAVRVPGRPDPVFLVRNCPELRPSAVTTVQAQQVLLPDGADVTLSLGETRYRLWVEAHAADRSDKKLCLSVSGSRQTLYAVDQASADEGWNLLWAGDVDGDGKLDLYVDASDHYNVSERRLYLSSRARDER